MDELAVNWDSIREAQGAITAWADRQFPNRKPEHTLLKMYEELGEYARNMKSGLELADTLVLLFDLAAMHGIDIAESLREKMRINNKREWVVDESTGLMRHKEGT